MFVYLVIWIESCGNCAEVFATRKDAEYYCKRMMDERKINCYIVEKSVRTSEYTDMVFGA